MLVQHDHPLNVIPNIVTPLRELVSSLPDILDTFRQYYSSLYSSVLPLDFKPRDLVPWLDPLALG